MKSGIITKEKIALMNEIKADPVAYKRLQDKAVWERMTMHAVLSGWGDPREWDRRSTPAVTEYDGG